MGTFKYLPRKVIKKMCKSSEIVDSRKANKTEYTNIYIGIYKSYWNFPRFV